MKFIIDLDGPVLDVQPQYLQAYAAVVAAAGRAAVRADEAWRLLRTGASDGQLLRGVRLDQVRKFRGELTEALERDDLVGLCTPQAGVLDALQRLKRAGELILVTTGANRFARQLLLDKSDLAVHFTRMQGLSADSDKRVHQLRELADSDQRVVVAGACEPVIRAAQLAGMLPVAVTNGACTGTRLTRIGAQLVYGDLGGLAEVVDRGSAELIQAGLLPPQPSGPTNPFLEPARLTSGRRSGSRPSYRQRR